MEYRRLGRSGLKVSLLSFGSWVTFGPQLAGDLAAECLTVARAAGVNFFDNAEVYAGGESERIMGSTIADLGWRRNSYVISTKFFMGPRGRGQRPQHAEPQVPARCHRRVARAARPRLRRPRLLPPPRPRDAGGGDGVGNVRHHRPGPGALLGDLGVAGGRRPRGLGGGRPPPPAQAGGRATPVQPAVAQPRRARVRPADRGPRPRTDHLEPAGLGPAHGQVPRRRARGLTGVAARLRVAAGTR